MTSPLLGLPLELLENVAEHCMSDGDRDTLLRMRSTCRHLQINTRRTWLHQYFSRRSIRLENEKLKELPDIAKVADLANVVKGLEVHCKDSGIPDNLDQGNENLSKTKLLRLSPMLALALQHFKNLEGIDFRSIDASSGSLISPSEGNIVECSDSFSATLLAVQACDIRLTRLAFYPSSWEGFDFGILDLTEMTQGGDCFSRLEVLNITLASSVISVNSIEDFAVADHLVVSLGHMKALKILNVDFAYASGCSDVAKKLFGLERLPCLLSAHFTNLECAQRDLTRFLWMHASTLRGLSLIGLGLSEDVQMSEFRALFRAIQEDLDLREFAVEDPYSSRGRIAFPGMEVTFSKPEPDEDGFIHVELEGLLRFSGSEEIKNGLARMADCMECAEWT